MYVLTALVPTPCIAMSYFFIRGVVAKLFHEKNMF